MNHDSGYGTNGAPFEYTVSEAKSKTLPASLAARFKVSNIGILPFTDVIS